jgi:hypothetical protein
MYASQLRNTAIICAGVVVIAGDDRLARPTLSIVALVSDGARIAIAAGALVGQVGASELWVTTIIGAEVSVFAIPGHLACAGTVDAGVVHGAEISIITRPSVIRPPTVFRQEGNAG